MALFSIITRHRSYMRAFSLAASYIKNPQQLRRLIDKAQAKADDGSYVYVTALGNIVSLPLRMLRAYVWGGYRRIHWRSLTMLTAAIIYFLMPFDFITDFLPLIGLMDDIGVLGWTLKQLKDDVDRFEAWEQSVATSSEQPDSALIEIEVNPVELVPPMPSPALRRKPPV
jgi:uncharacterized membrane protein YkvA (DUF1232 family)